MKDISQLSKDLEQKMGKLIDRLKIVQSDAADEVLEHLRMNANMDTSEFVESIYKTDTTYDGNMIETKVQSGLQVTSSDGKSYNLGYLLEMGTSPHIIRPVNASALRFEVNGKEVFAKEVNHPGTIAYNNYRNAMNAVRPEYQRKISEAVKEALK